MALLQTAFLADKFSGLSCVLFLIWMIPIGVKAMQDPGKDALLDPPET